MTLKPEVEQALRALLVEMTSALHGRGSFGPADAARRFGGESWRRWMEPVKDVARALASEGALDVTRHGKPVTTWPWRGVIRFRARADGAPALDAGHTFEEPATPASAPALPAHDARLWSDAPVFTEPGARPPYVPRPSAYALIEDAERRLAIVRTPQGTVFPGGGLEAGETPDRAIEREAREECGFAVRVGRWTARAIQRVYSTSEDVHFEKLSTFREARVTKRGLERVEFDHELVWVTRAEALGLLSHASQRWAVERWSERSLAR